MSKLFEISYLEKATQKIKSEIIPAISMADAFLKFAAEHIDFHVESLRLVSIAFG